MEKPFQRHVDGRYGAPMGRPSDAAKTFVGKVHLQYVPFIDQAYDQGGAYWGMPADLWCAWDDEGHEMYMRAPSRDRAKVETGLAANRFYR